MVDGEESDFHPWGPGGTSWPRSAAIFMIPPDLSRRVFAGAALELAITAEVFETSEPGTHHWLPEQGDFKILWRDEIRGSYR